MDFLKKKTIDLHVHTNHSDGTFSPEEVVAYARKTGLSAIAITDHDCVDAIELCKAAAKNSNLEIVPGVELSAEVDDFEIHIVGLLIDYNVPWFLEQLKQIRQARLVRMQKMVEKLNKLGVEITFDEVMAFSRDDAAIGRLHLARVLFHKGITSSIKEAFERFIGRDGPCYVKRIIISPQKVIEMIRKLKGVPVFAHPGNMRHDEIIPELLEYGLMAIEAFHIDHSWRKSQYYTSLAKKHNLLLSGGSDCHGAGKGFPLMGMVKVPYHILENIKKAKTVEYSGT